MEVTSVLDAATDSEDSVGLNETLCYTSGEKKGLENVASKAKETGGAAVSEGSNISPQVEDASNLKPPTAAETTPVESPTTPTPTSTKKHSHNIGELAKATFDMSGDETSQDNID